MANRGEIARRIIRGARDLGMKTVAVYSEADQAAPYVKLADEAYFLGPSPSSESYLHKERILEVARRAGADAIHPGYGFLSENADFAQACREAGVHFVGPSPEAIRRIGNKLCARQLARKLGIPVVPGAPRGIGLREATRRARELGLPVLLKAAGGGGGRGMRVVRDLGELPRAFREATAEAQGAFRNSQLFMEKYIERPRHVEIQILGDTHGTVLHLHERECSLQRRHQKLLEESPSPVLDSKTREAMARAAVRLAEAAGYSSAGTAEFLLTPNGEFYFLEVNSRLQVEHPVTELRTGIDLVAMQLRIASGEPLGFRQGDVHPRGHAMECRIVAEDPFQGFVPCIGRVTALALPAGPFIRVDTDLAAGLEVTPHYDSLLAKLVAWGQTRDEAILRARRALLEFRVAGVRTTIPLFLRLFEEPRFQRGEIHTGALEEAPVREKGDPLSAALLAVAMELHSRDRNSLGGVPQSSWRAAIQMGFER